MGASVGGAPGEALGVCVVRGCRGNEKSRQFPDERAVYRSGASPVSATTVGFCNLCGAIHHEQPGHGIHSSQSSYLNCYHISAHALPSNSLLALGAWQACMITEAAE